MLKSTLEKIEKLIKDKEYQLPEIMMKLLSFLMQFAKKIELKNAEYAALDLYADAYKLFKSFIVQQPFKLKKIAIRYLNDNLNTGSNNALWEIFCLRDRFTKQLSAFTPTDPIGRKTVSELMDLKWVKKISTLLSNAEAKKNQLQAKKGKISNMSELAVLFWYEILQGQYLIHIDLFAEKLLDFLLQYLHPLDFLDKNGLPCLKELADPDRRYYMTAGSCQDLFLKIRCTQTIDRLWQYSQEKANNLPFISQSSVMMRISTLDLTIDELIGVTGQKLILAGGEEKDVKQVPAVLVGSSPDCDIVLKNKYISRRQMVIIEDSRPLKVKQKDSKKYNFSIVCLSQANYTIISYPHQTKPQLGLIFYAQSVKYQIVKYEKIQLSQNTQQDDQDRTLSILPSDKNNTSNTYQKLTFLILSGEDKQQQVTYSSNSEPTVNELDAKHRILLKEAFFVQKEIFLKPQVKILCKTSNDILEGKISRKIRLRKGLKIFLDDYVLTVE